jgi:RecA/RadA recombinase
MISDMSEKLDKDILASLNALDDVTPYSSFLNESTLSSVDDWIDTGSMVLNALISGSLYGGVPKGRVVQFAGPSMCGKSFFALQIAANAQKKGMVPVIFDTEGAIDPETAENFGLDTSKVKYLACESAEQTRNAIFAFLTAVREKKQIGKFIIIIDSLANLNSEMELKRMGKDSTSADMGTFAKSIKSLLKTCTNMGTLTKTPIIITNHVYDDPSAMFPSLEKHMTGGKSAVYLPSVNVQLARELIKDVDNKQVTDKLSASQKSYSGVVLRALMTKNRFAKQYLEGRMYLSFSKGLDKYFGLLDIMKDMGVVSNSGSSYTDWEGTKLGYYKVWSKKIDLWEEKLLPELEKRIKIHWAYGSSPEEDNLSELEDAIQLEE